MIYRINSTNYIKMKYRLILVLSCAVFFLDIILHVVNSSLPVICCDSLFLQGKVDYLTSTVYVQICNKRR